MGPLSNAGARVVPVRVGSASGWGSDGSAGLQCGSGDPEGFVGQSDYLCAAFREKFPEYGAVAAILIFAIAAERNIRVMTESGEHIEFAGAIGISHFGAELTLEFCECALVRCLKSFLN